MCELTEDAALAQRTGVLQQQPGVDTVSVILVKTRQHPQTLRQDFIDALLQPALYRVVYLNHKLSQKAASV